MGQQHAHPIEKKKPLARKHYGYAYSVSVTRGSVHFPKTFAIFTDFIQLNGCQEASGLICANFNPASGSCTTLKRLEM